MSKVVIFLLKLLFWSCHYHFPDLNSALWYVCLILSVSLSISLSPPLHLSLLLLSVYEKCIIAFNKHGLLVSYISKNEDICYDIDVEVSSKHVNICPFVVRIWNTCVSINLSLYMCESTQTANQIFDPIFSNFNFFKDILSSPHSFRILLNLVLTVSVETRDLKIQFM